MSDHTFKVYMYLIVFFTERVIYNSSVPGAITKTPINIGLKMSRGI